jgi:hypothetical protein
LIGSEANSEGRSEGLHDTSKKLRRQFLPLYRSGLGGELVARRCFNARTHERSNYRSSNIFGGSGNKSSKDNNNNNNINIMSSGGGGVIANKKAATLAKAEAAA